jgi:hypothetical protein
MTHPRTMEQSNSRVELDVSPVFLFFIFFVSFCVLFSFLFSSTGTVGPGHETRHGGSGTTAPLAMDVGIAEEIDVVGRETVDQVKKIRIFFCGCGYHREK